MFSSFYSYLVLFVFLQYPVTAVDQRFFIGFLHILTRLFLKQHFSILVGILVGSIFQPLRLFFVNRRFSRPTCVRTYLSVPSRYCSMHLLMIYFEIGWFGLTCRSDERNTLNLSSGTDALVPGCLFFPIFFALFAVIVRGLCC